MMKGKPLFGVILFLLILLSCLSPSQMMLAKSTVDTSAVINSDVEDSDGTPTHLDGIFQIVDEEGSVGYGLDMAQDPEGYCHLSYSTFETDGPIKYARYYGINFWKVSVVEYLCEQVMTSIAVDSSFKPHISYSDWINNTVKYATLLEDGNWSIEIVDDTIGNICYHHSTAIGIDSNDYPHIAYYDKDNGTLKHAYKTSSGSIYPGEGSGRPLRGTV